MTLSLGLGAAELKRQLRALLGEDAPDLNGRRYRIRLGQAAANRLATVLRRVWEEPPGEPVPPADTNGLSRDEQNLVSTACEIVTAGWPHRAEQPPESRTHRERLLLAATDVIKGSEGAIDLTSLCEHLGVSAETLRLVFREFVGIPPMRYAKLHRMHLCRGRLKTADPAIENVKSVAMQCGVRHLGRFSVEYWQMFGEHPSETLRAG